MASNLPSDISVATADFSNISLIGIKVDAYKRGKGGDTGYASTQANQRVQIIPDDSVIDETKLELSFEFEGTKVRFIDPLYMEFKKDDGSYWFSGFTHPYGISGIWYGIWFSGALNARKAFTDKAAEYVATVPPLIAGVHWVKANIINSPDKIADAANKMHDILHAMYNMQVFFVQGNLDPKKLGTIAQALTNGSDIGTMMISPSYDNCKAELVGVDYYVDLFAGYMECVLNQEDRANINDWNQALANARTQLNETSQTLTVDYDDAQYKQAIDDIEAFRILHQAFFSRLTYVEPVKRTLSVAAYTNFRELDSKFESKVREIQLDVDSLIKANDFIRTAWFILKRAGDFVVGTGLLAGHEMQRAVAVVKDLFNGDFAGVLVNTLGVVAEFVGAPARGVNETIFEDVKLRYADKIGDFPFDGFSTDFNPKHAGDWYFDEEPDSVVYYAGFFFSPIVPDEYTHFNDPTQFDVDKVYTTEGSPYEDKPLHGRVGGTWSMHIAMFVMNKDSGGLDSDLDSVYGVEQKDYDAFNGAIVASIGDAALQCVSAYFQVRNINRLRTYNNLMLPQPANSSKLTPQEKEYQKIGKTYNKAQGLGFMGRLLPGIAIGMAGANLAALIHYKRLFVKDMSSKLNELLTFLGKTQGSIWRINTNGEAYKLNDYVSGVKYKAPIIDLSGMKGSYGAPQDNSEHDNLKVISRYVQMRMITHVPILFIKSASVATTIAAAATGLVLTKAIDPLLKDVYSGLKNVVHDTGLYPDKEDTLLDGNPTVVRTPDGVDYSSKKKKKKKKYHSSR